MELQQDNIMTDRNRGEIVLYNPDNTIKIDVLIERETVWLTQTQMSLLFNRDRTVINRHIRNIFEEGELNEKEVCAKFAHTTKHGAIRGKTQTTEIMSYNLDVVISVGYRVKSKQGTRFRQWANRVLKEYLLKGYVFNQRLETVEKFAIETEWRVSKTENEITKLKYHIESVLSDYNDINEDTRMQLELINQSLAELQAKKKEAEKPRPQIGYVAIMERRKNEGKE